jgi:ABC-type glycerol-3-phosphate transport system substrate-binding protein
MNQRHLLRGSFPLCFAVASLLLLAGCPDKTAKRPANSPTAQAPQPLTVLVVDDEPLGQAIAREWKARTEENITIQDVTPAEIASSHRLPGDAIVFPSSLIGDLAERELIMPLQPALLEDAEFNYRDIFDQIRLGETRWGTRTWATPLGSPQLLLVYRADVFDRLGLQAPTDWNEYQRLIERLADRSALGELAPPVGQPWRPAFEPLLGPCAGQLLLARGLPYAMHREQISPLFRLDNMQPLIDQPPYVRALEELVAAARSAGYADDWTEPGEVFQSIRRGHCAMALTWPVNELTAGGPEPFDTKLRFALLPGSNEAYRFATKTWETRGAGEESRIALRAISGQMAAVSAASDKATRAQGFVVWLSGREVSQQVSPRSASTTLFRQSQAATSTRWTGNLPPETSRQYAETLAQSLSLSRGFGLTLAGNYILPISGAVREALQGKPAQEALAEAARNCSALTEKAGVESQIRANARSLGQEAR